MKPLKKTRGWQKKKKGGSNGRVEAVDILETDPQMGWLSVVMVLQGKS